MELKDSGTLSYAAMPIALDVNILQNGAMNILRELANLKLISINYKQKTTIKEAQTSLEIMDTKPNRFTAMRVKTKNFKFNREEANER
jgi:hypothetical protein